MNDTPETSLPKLCAIRDVHGFSCQFDGAPASFHFNGKDWCMFHLPAGDRSDIINKENNSGKGSYQYGWEVGGTLRDAFSAEVNKRISEASGRLADLRGVVFPTGFTFPIIPASSSLLCEFAIFGGVVNFNTAAYIKYVNFNRATFEGAANFSHLGFGAGAIFSGATFGGEAIFEGARFEDGASFSGATFGDWARFDGAAFGDGASFGGAKFGRLAGFDGATFGFGAFFEGATFWGGARFGGAIFVGWALFGGVTFGSRAILEGATFWGGASLSGAIFEDEAIFDGATFGGRAIFDGATFGKLASFEGARFGGEANFREAIFQGRADFSVDDASSATFGFRHLDVSKAKYFGPCIFENRAFNTQTLFNGAEFHDLVEFHGCTFHQGMSFHDADFLKTHGGYNEEGFENDAATEVLERSYRTLKLGMETLRARNEEAYFFAKEMECRRRRGDIGFFAWLAATVYKHLSSYGRSILRPVLWLGGLTLFMWGVYFTIGFLTLPATSNPAHDTYYFVVEPWRTARFTLEQMFRPFAIWSSPINGDVPVNPDDFSEAFTRPEKTYPRLHGIIVPLLASAQSLATLGLLTLFLLALRRRFKMD